MQRVRAIAQISLWVILLTAFFSVTAPEIFRRTATKSITLAGDTPFHSSDSFLQFVGGPPRASEPLIGLFDLASPQKPVLILDRGDDPASSLLGMLTAYLAWPHPVQIIDRARIGGSSATPLWPDLHSTAAIVACRVPRPPGLPEGKHFGSALEFLTTGLTKP